MKAIYEDHALERLPGIVSGRKRILLVTGKASFEFSGAAGIVPALEKSSAVMRWSDFSPNTDSADVWRGIQAMRSFDPDLVVAIGGGSVLDTAKIFAAYAGISSEPELQDRIRSGQKISGGKTPLVLVPTTSGSGSEATHFAVVYIGQEKFSVAGEGLRACAVILDPLLTLSGSAYQKATSGIDAVCQAVESLWAVAGTDQSRRYARHALSFLLRHIESFVRTGDKESARGMVIGSYLAGRAIDISKTTAAHALSYAITKQYGVSHGHAVALTLGGFIEAHAGTPHMKYILGAFDAASAEEAAEKFRALLLRIGLSARLTENGVMTASAREGIASAVNLERLLNNPVALTPDEVTKILERAA